MGYTSGLNETNIVKRITHEIIFLSYTIILNFVKKERYNEYNHNRSEKQERCQILA
jgi:hypothetical protein